MTGGQSPCQVFYDRGTVPLSCFFEILVKNEDLSYTMGYLF